MVYAGTMTSLKDGGRVADDDHLLRDLLTLLQEFAMTAGTWFSGGEV